MKIFERVLDQVQLAEIRDRAWFLLGKVHYRASDLVQAEAALSRVGDTLPRNMREEHRMLLALTYMAGNRNLDAARILSEADEKAGWYWYARFNLAVALIREGQVDEGAALLAEAGELNTGDEELLALRDRANLALGYAFLQSRLGGDARPVLERVRLSGRDTNKALLGIGWADAAEESYERALVPWQALAEENLLDSAVQESLLAVPYALAQMGVPGAAARAYLSAADTYETEIVRLDKAIDRARSGELVLALLESTDEQPTPGAWELEALPGTDDSRYLFAVISDHAFHEGMRSLRELHRFEQRSERWQERLAAFDEMLATRAAASAALAPRLTDTLAETRVADLIARRDSLAARLAAAKEKRQLTSLATGEEKDQWERLAALETLPGFDSAPAAEHRRRQRILKGYLVWQLDAAFKFRAWEQSRELDGIDRQIDELRSRYESLAEAPVGGTTDDFALGARVHAMRQRLARTRTTLAAVLNRSTEQLDQLAVAALESQRKRLRSYQAQARFALATIYDQAAVTKP
jgi:hypothetical protein